MRLGCRGRKRQRHLAARARRFLTDSLSGNWANIVMLCERGVELVSRLNKALRQSWSSDRNAPCVRLARWQRSTQFPLIAFFKASFTLGTSVSLIDR
jgi:hypothetical protein